MQIKTHFSSSVKLHFIYIFILLTYCILLTSIINFDNSAIKTRVLSNRSIFNRFQLFLDYSQISTVSNKLPTSL